MNRISSTTNVGGRSFPLSQEDGQMSIQEGRLRKVNISQVRNLTSKMTDLPTPILLFLWRASAFSLLLQKGVAFSPPSLLGWCCLISSFFLRCCLPRPPLEMILLHSSPSFCTVSPLPLLWGELLVPSLIMDRDNASLLLSFLLGNGVQKRRKINPMIKKKGRSPSWSQSGRSIPILLLLWSSTTFLPPSLRKCSPSPSLPPPSLLLMLSFLPPSFRPLPSRGSCFRSPPRFLSSLDRSRSPFWMKGDPNSKKKIESHNKKKEERRWTLIPRDKKEGKSIGSQMKNKTVALHSRKDLRILRKRIYESNDIRRLFRLRDSDQRPYKWQQLCVSTKRVTEWSLRLMSSRRGMQRIEILNSSLWHCVKKKLPVTALLPTSCIRRLSSLVRICLS